MKQFLIGAVAAAAAFASFAGNEANARFSPVAIEVPAHVEYAACTVRRVRTVRPNGRVTYRTVRRCTPAPRCRTVHERVVRNGRVIYRTVRRCR